MNIQHIQTLLDNQQSALETTDEERLSNRWETERNITEHFSFPRLSGMFFFYLLQTIILLLK